MNRSTQSDSATTAYLRRFDATKCVKLVRYKKTGTDTSLCCRCFDLRRHEPELSACYVKEYMHFAIEKPVDTYEFPELKCSLCNSRVGKKRSLMECEACYFKFKQITRAEAARVRMMNSYIYFVIGHSEMQQ